MFQSPVAGGIVWGLGISSLWLIPIGFASITETGITGFAGCTVVMLIVAAAIAEAVARKKKGARRAA